MADLRVRPTFGKKGRPHGHGKIERFMGTMNRQLATTPLSRMTSHSAAGVRSWRSTEVRTTSATCGRW
ncbi:hypothetical protein ACSDR0_41370 [Streptosporangium sp. G11]|uniref:hypothetical protein n=1 Tax=Streptosporangium sp. G11 TaxID=3436926 RepID=UPI003EBBEB3B